MAKKLLPRKSGNRVLHVDFTITNKDEISEKLEAISVKQFDKLFLYSQRKIFENAYDTANDVFENLLTENVQKVYYDFVGFNNCFGEQLSLFRENERKILVEVNSVALEIRKKSLIRAKNLEFEYKKRREQKLRQKSLSTEKKDSLKIKLSTNNAVKEKTHIKNVKTFKNVHLLKEL